MKSFSEKSVPFLIAVILSMSSSLALSMPAEAQKRTNRNRVSDHISWTQLVQKLEGEGYRIREIEMKRDGWEANVIHKGNRYELRLDTKGRVLRKKWDD